MSELPDDTLMALPRQATVSKALQRYRKKVTDAANGDTPLSAIPKDLLFDIPESFADIVVFDSGPGVGAKLQATNRVPRPVDRGTATRYGG